MIATEIRGTRRAVFAGLLFSAMAVATFSSPSLAVLATFVIEDLSISRTALGVVLAVVNVLAAVLSPGVGRITDRVGGKAALVGLFLVAVGTYVVFGITVAYAMLVIGASLAAISQAAANPSTNRLIAEALPPGERGVVTGIKQSGVQAGIFLGGLILPTLATALGWRGAYLIVAAIPALFAVVAAVVVPPAPATGEERRRRSRGRLPVAIRWLATYGFLLGFSGAVMFFAPLYIVEDLGLDPRVAGIVMAVVGLISVATRILWSRYAEVTGRFRTSLAIMALLSIVAAVAFWLAGSAASAAWLLWPAAIFIALGSSSWNSVGMLAVIEEAGTDATGRASGVVLFGFLTGLGIAPPLFGAIVDQTGSYNVMWLLSALTAAAAIIPIMLWRRSAA
jgi:MFS family permease